MTPDPLTPSPDSPTPLKDKFPSGQWPNDLELAKKILADTPRAAALLDKLLYHPGNEQWNQALELSVQLERELAALVKEREELRTEIQASDEQQTRLAASIANLRTTLAERDDRISWLETQREVECQQKQDAFDERDGFAKEADTLRAQLAEAQLKLKEAEKSNQEHFRDAKSLAMQCMDLRAVLGKCVVQLGHIRSGYILGSEIDEAYDLALRLVSYEAAIQAHAGECRSVLKLVDATNERAYTAALKLLASQPDLPLIEEVREVLDEADTHLRVYSDSSEHLVNRIKQLLARLNPRKD